jgi:hypothetical protein
MPVTTPRAARRLALALGLAFASLSPSAARAGDEPNASAPPSRLAALELEIRCLDRHLGVLRKARTEVAAGRAEPAPDDEAEQKSADADRRALDEIRRYENARARALKALEKASEAKDEAKASETRAAIETLDGEFVSAIHKIDESRPAKPSKPDRAAKGDRADDDKKDKPEKAPKGEGKKDMGD